ncbi:MAG: hypothetical protein DPW18_11590 [Chloroflexi bacterium]|nr:hypothetical protein [Chloroflexota bacterium]MDL1942045.1 hypothetical protein [Chloroflexi bacterium CFX2]
MTIPQRQLPHVPPFKEPQTQPPRKNGVDTRGMLSIVTMLVSLAALTVSMLGAAKLVFAVFDDGLENSLDGLFVKLVVLGLAFFFGWGVGLASIRGFGNLVYPMVINFYAWVCLGAVSILYLKVIQKLYMQQYDALRFWAYLVILLGGLFVLICLHLLVENHDLRPFAIPLLIISVLQLFVIVYRYVFTAGANGWMVIGDFAVFFVMISISALMLMHIGILSPLRGQIDVIFVKNGNSGSRKPRA